MEGLLDFVLRDVLTRVGAWTVRVGVHPHHGQPAARQGVPALCARAAQRRKPHLAGVPVRAQLLGSDPVCMAENAARLAALQPEGIDLNFGCPAKWSTATGRRSPAAGA